MISNTRDFVKYTEPLGLQINLDKSGFTATFTDESVEVDRSDIIVALYDGRIFNFKHNNSSLLLG